MNKERLTPLIQEVQDHLFNELIPFWLTHGTDKEYGGYLTYLDKDGNATGEGTKTLVCQTRMIYSAASAHRANLGDGQFLEIARQGVEFLLKHFWDNEYTGWYWTTSREGTPENRSKLTYGHSFAIYCPESEYAMASGDNRALEMAVETYKTLTNRAADTKNGGFPGIPGGRLEARSARAFTAATGSRFDVHMHLMEAFTNLYEATGEEKYKEDACYVIDLLFKHMIHPEFGTGVAQFALDWDPLRAIIFRDVWGSDRDVEEDEGRPLNNTSFGHNVEFGWLLKHSVDILGLDLDDLPGADAEAL